MTAPAKSFPARLFSSTAFQLSALVVAAFAVMAGIIVYLLFLQTNAILTEQALATLKTEAGVLVRDAREGGLDKLKQSVASRSPPQGPALYLLTDARGEKLAGNLSQVPPEIAESPTGGVFRYSSSPNNGSRLGVALRVDLENGARLLVGRDIEDQRAFAARIRYLFLASFGLLALAGLAAGLALSRLVLRRIATMTATSRSIMSGDLTRRVPLAGTGDELDDLATNLNAMLDRIEELMTGLREVSDNIAHDLKSPVTRLRNRAEAALRDNSGADAYREGLEHTIEEADELIKTFNAILLIARLEAGVLEETADRFELGSLVRDVGELYQPLAEEAGLALTVAAGTGPRLKANRQLIGQAVANLIDNAIKYSSRSTSRRPSAPARPIAVAVRTAGSAIEIEVADCGPGIAAADRERVLKRFVRLEESRTRPGTGLGLNLVAAVARLHGGKLRLEENNPGLRAVLELPLRLVVSDETSGAATPRSRSAQATAAPAKG